MRVAAGTAVLLVIAVSAFLFSRHERAQDTLRLFTELISAKNDNDPRWDHGFDGLSDAAKDLLRAEYERFPREARYERGSVVYVLGRNLKTEADWAFFRKVVAEPPCLSLADCAKPPSGPIDPAVGDEVTLAYPALMALKQAERGLAGPSAAQARSVIAAGKASSVPPVAALAAGIGR